MADRDAEVCLTFDSDAISVWPGMVGVTPPSAVSRGEFCGRVAVARRFDVLRREGVSAACFIPGIRVEASPPLCRRILDEHGVQFMTGRAPAEDWRDRGMPDRLAVRSGQSREFALRGEAFPERARSALRAAGGETPRRQPGHASESLNPQEAQFPGLAIGSQMSISPRTVQPHVRKVAGELDVSLRRELGDRAMPR